MYNDKNVTSVAFFLCPKRPEMSKFACKMKKSIAYVKKKLYLCATFCGSIN